ncbi:Hint domain-containing protein [Gluconobacter cerinus]|uniref:Membrane protein n=1 Tax=Gluconobacter cerinus TaxID=38307 RepID=A0A1B6VGF6_9PROT|nr:membrane protein [Gluconobacter cerinus]
MSLIYGYNNTVTQSGSYTLVPAVPVLGIISIGGASANFSGKNVNASVNFSPSLISLANPWSVTSSNNAFVTVTGLTGGVVNALTGATFTADGGTISMDSASTISALSGSTYNISSGGKLILNSVQNQAAISALSGSKVAFGKGGGTLLINPGSNVSVISFQSISGFENAGSTIEIPGATKVVSVSKNGNSTNIVTDNGKTITVSGDFYDYGTNNNLFQSYQDGNLFISSTPVNNTSQAGVLVCFLRNSIISVPNGKKAVQDIVMGDEVLCYKDGVTYTDIVRWAGHAHCTVRPYLPLDQAGYPVRILKDAVSDGVPFKDMLITAEHCLFFEGKFVPARMLVNGRSIFYDTSITSYDYYHIETEEHSVIMADGMLTESYLDTGNRNAFRQAGEVVSLTPSRNLSWEDAAASLTVARDLVEPLFRQIETRAVHLNSPLMTDTPFLTQENDLHLVTDTGATLRPIRKNNDRIMFMIPAGVENVRIVSNASRPCDVVGPFVDDRRMLGLLVGDVQLFEGHATKTLTSHLQDIDLSGWNNVEDGIYRWTNGSALLPLGARPIGSIALMALQVHASGPYLASGAEAANLHALQA